MAIIAPVTARVKSDILCAMLVDEADYRCGSEGRKPHQFPVVISGCSGGGKSSILAELRRRGYEVIPEAGRQIVREQLFIGSDGLPWVNIDRFIDLAVSRAMYAYNAANADSGRVFTDRSVVDLVCAYERVHGTLPGYLEHALQAYRYFDTVFMVPPWKELFVSDRERQHTFEEAVEEYDSLIPFYERSAGYNVVTVPRDTISARADFIERQL